MKKCSVCKESKPLDAFHKNVKNKDGRGYTCRECAAAYHRKRHETNPHRIPAMRYGITEQEYVELLARSNGRCELCGKIVESKRAMHIDHDHSCCSDRATSCGKCIRGVLCSTCNTGLGCFKDDEQLLRKAIEYLKIRKK